jgi:hypothetical protein
VVAINSRIHCQVKIVHCSSISVVLSVTVSLLGADGGVGGVIGNGAGILAVGQSDEARLSPGSSPRVADLPVGVDIDADSLHTVVDGLAADTHDAARVRVPRGGIHAHREGTGALHVRSHGGLAREGGVAGNGGHKVTGVGRAAARGALVGGVRVGSLGLNASSLLHIAVRVLGPATVAAVRGRVTLDNLLGGQQIGSALCADEVRLDLLGGGESPAGAAVALVLNGSGIFPSPVKQTKISLGRLRDLQHLGAANSLGGIRAQVAGSELLLGQIEELGHAVNGGTVVELLGLVSLLGDLEVVQEVAEAGALLSVGAVTLAILLLELVPHVLLQRGQPKTKLHICACNKTT